MNIEVENKRDMGLYKSPNYVYVGRPSVLGNPFFIGRDGLRDVVISKYKAWLWDNLKSNNKQIIDELMRLRELAKNYHNLVLICWCKPQACHGDVIKSCIEWLDTLGKTEKEIRAKLTKLREQNNHEIN